MRKNSYNREYFSLKLSHDESLLKISMQIHSPYVNTKSFPATYNFLKENFPGVLLTQCFNDKNLPFSHEVKETEIGHLFEHILIEQLKNIKVQRGHKKVVINGRTCWDWYKNPYGLFEIFIDIEKQENYLMDEALHETIQLVELLFVAHTKNPVGNLVN